MAQRDYPVNVAVVSQNNEGDFVTSRSDTVGIPVGGKVDFAIISPPAEINPGNKKVITVEYKNMVIRPFIAPRQELAPWIRLPAMMILPISDISTGPITNGILCDEC